MIDRPTLSRNTFLPVVIAGVLGCAESTDQPDSYDWCDASTWPGPQTTCAEVNESATEGHGAIDIILVVDTSGSMDDEKDAVRENLNAFTTKIAEKGYDTHVVLLSKQYPYQDEEGVWEYDGICVDAPLGSGECPSDSNLPDFLHPAVEVASYNALSQVINSHSLWGSMIRDDSSKHLVVITDEDSSLGADFFMNGIRDIDIAFEELIVHAIASSMNPNPACELDPPHPCCWYATGKGKVYMELAEDTGGLFADLCEQNFAEVFEALALIVAGGGPLDCQWDLPEAPDGLGLELASTSVDFIDGASARHRLCRVENQSECDGERHAWYLDNDDNPSTVIVCPYTCEQIKTDLEAQIDIKFGCFALDGGPE